MSSANVVEITESKKMIQYTSRVMDLQRKAFRSNPVPSLDERQAWLKLLKQTLLNNQKRIADAINKDFGNRSADETRILEFLPSIQEIDHTQSELGSWMKPSRRHVTTLFLPASNTVHYKPKGVVGVIVPWNYPLLLAVGPMIGALAAGNRVFVKMSEFTPHFGMLFKELMEDTFPLDLVAVVLGEADVAADFSSRAWDHLVFTGSTSVGRHVMRSAAEHLTPVTLELGGKTPAIIARDATMTEAARRLVFGKSVNAGQTCIAPDYLLCPQDKLDELLAEIKSQFAGMYPTIRDNKDYSSIINQRQYDRLKGLIDDASKKGARLISVNPAQEPLTRESGKIPLTLVLDGTNDMTVMQDEIFGPILPIVTYQTLEEAVDYVNDRPRPLALYYFGHTRSEQEYVLDHTHSGGACINDSLMHIAHSDMPFGGIGPSGMGHYHGHEGFLTFSHARAVFKRQLVNTTRAIYPPYGTALHSLFYKMFIR